MKVSDVESDATDEKKLNTDPAALEEKKLNADPAAGKDNPAAEMGGGVEEFMEMDKEEVFGEFLLEDGDNEYNDDDMNEMRNGMLTFLQITI